MTQNEMEFHHEDESYHGRLNDGREIVVSLDEYNDALQDRTPQWWLDSPEEWAKVARVNPNVIIKA